MSYARVGIFRFRPGTSNDIIRTTQQNAATFMGELPGFLSYRSVLAEEGRAVSLSIWEREDQARDASQLLDQWIDRTVPSLLTESDIFFGEVSVEEEVPVALPSRQTSTFVPEARH